MYLKVQVQVPSHFNWWRNINPRSLQFKPPISRSFVRSFVRPLTRQKFSFFIFRLLLFSLLLLFSSSSSSSGSSTKKYQKVHISAEIGFVPYLVAETYMTF